MDERKKFEAEAVEGAMEHLPYEEVALYAHITEILRDANIAFVPLAGCILFIPGTLDSFLKVTAGVKKAEIEQLSEENTSVMVEQLMRLLTDYPMLLIKDGTLMYKSKTQTFTKELLDPTSLDCLDAIISEVKSLQNSPQPLAPDHRPYIGDVDPGADTSRQAAP